MIGEWFSLGWDGHWSRGLGSLCKVCSGLVEGGVFGGAGIRCIGRARDERLVCTMAVVKVSRFCSLADRMSIRRIPFQIPCPMGDKGFYGKNREI